MNKDFPFSEEGLDQIYEWILGGGTGSAGRERKLNRKEEKWKADAFHFSSQTHLYNKRIFPLLTLCSYFIIVL